MWNFVVYLHTIFNCPNFIYAYNFLLLKDTNLIFWTYFYVSLIKTWDFVASRKCEYLWFTSQMIEKWGTLFESSTKFHMMINHYSILLIIVFNIPHFFVNISSWNLSWIYVTFCGLLFTYFFSTLKSKPQTHTRCFAM